jgi:glutamate carboxypeptidase
MKAGLVIAEYALRALQALGEAPRRPVVAIMNSDEEIGSRSSRALIESEGARAAYVLVLEPANLDGSLKTARKGVGAFSLEVHGRASHAGAAPEQGVSAIGELAAQVVRLHAMSDPDVGTTVNVGVVEGGSRSNVVAASARAQIDVRAWTRVDAERLAARIRGLEPIHPDAHLTISGGFGRMPMERTPEAVRLFTEAQRIGREIGLELNEGASGGGSDGNFTAALGTPTLDGLGALGAGAHAADEFVELSSLPQRTALLAGLLAEV